MTRNKYIRIIVVLGFLLAIFVIAPYAPKTKRDIKSVDTALKTDTISVDDVNIDDEKYIPKEDSITEYYDRLDTSKYRLPIYIIDTLRVNLKKYNWNNSLRLEKLGSLYHETVFARTFYSNKHNDEFMYVVTFSNSTGNMCRACAGVLSLFKFKKIKSKWYPDKKFLNFTVSDEFGMEPLGFQLVKIGKYNRRALVIHSEYSGNNGHDAEYRYFFAEVKDTLREIFEFTSYEYYNSPDSAIKYIDGNVLVRIINTGKMWYDIETKPEYSEWGDKRDSLVKRFVFDGNLYVEKR